MAMWSMLGARGVDVLAWESFGAGWANDATKQLNLENCRGSSRRPMVNCQILNQMSISIMMCCSPRMAPRPVCAFRTMTGSRANRAGLTFADATSAAFAQPIDWPKVDVLTFSWQKVMGGEAAHGMLVLSPRAVERLETYAPPRPLPKIFRLTKAGKVDQRRVCRRDDQHAVDAVR